MDKTTHPNCWHPIYLFPHLAHTIWGILSLPARRSPRLPQPRHIWAENIFNKGLQLSWVTMIQTWHFALAYSNLLPPQRCFPLPDPQQLELEPASSSSDLVNFQWNIKKREVWNTIYEYIYEVFNPYHLASDGLWMDGSIPSSYIFSFPPFL